MAVTINLNLQIERNTYMKTCLIVLFISLLAITHSQAWIFDHGKEKEMQQEIIHQEQITARWQAGTLVTAIGGILLITGTIVGSKGRKTHEKNH